jgi:hypothetical protein
MPRWILGIISGCLVLCVGCGALFLMFLRHEQTVVAQAMANVIATQVADNIGSRALRTGQIVLTEEDLDVNTAISLDGSCGVNVINSDAEIYGVTTEITTAEIAFSCVDARYSAVPVVQDGRVELTEIQGPSGVMRFVFSKDKLKQGFEKGINDALAANGVKPTGITLQSGSVTILTESAGI